MINSIDITNKINRAPDYRIVLNKYKNIPLSDYIEKYKNLKITNYNDNNNNNISQYYNYNILNQQDKYEYIDEINLDIELDDDNISNNIFSFKYDLNNKINNIHYIDIIKISYPDLYIINKEIYQDNNILNYIKDNHINLIIGKTYNNNNIRYNIHNKNENNIFISINEEYEIIYEIIYEENIIYKYYINKEIKLQSLNNIILSIKELDNNQSLSTNDKSYYNILYIDKIINNYIYYKTRNCYHIYKKSNLLTLSKLTININDKNNNLSNYKKIIDITSKNNICNCVIKNNLPGCKCTYILHKNYFKLKPIISIKLGIIKLDIIKKIIN